MVVLLFFPYKNCIIYIIAIQSAHFSLACFFASVQWNRGRECVPLTCVCVCTQSALPSNQCQDIIFGKFILMHVRINIFPCLHYFQRSRQNIHTDAWIPLLLWIFFSLENKIHLILHNFCSGKLMVNIKQAEKCIQIQLFCPPLCLFHCFLNARSYACSFLCGWPEQKNDWLSFVPNSITTSNLIASRTWSSWWYGLFFTRKKIPFENYINKIWK